MSQAPLRAGVIWLGMIDSAAMGSGRMREALQAGDDSYPYLHGMNKPLLPEGIARPDDIADAVIWLASDQSKFVTGSQLSVDLGVAYT